MPTAIPILRVFDYDKAIEFYVKWLGAEVQWEHMPEDAPFYLEVKIRDVRIHLSAHHGDCSPGGKILIIDFQGLKAFHGELIASRYPYMRPGLENVPWDPASQSVTVIDPFFNHLQFVGPRA